MLYIVSSDYAYAGIIVRQNKVIKAAPIYKYMVGWTLDKVEDYCKLKKWTVTKYESNR